MSLLFSILLFPLSWIFCGLFEYFLNPTTFHSWLFCYALCIFSVCSLGIIIYSLQFSLSPNSRNALLQVIVVMCYSYILYQPYKSRLYFSLNTSSVYRKIGRKGVKGHFFAPLRYLLFSMLFFFFCPEHPNFHLPSFSFSLKNTL